MKPRGTGKREERRMKKHLFLLLVGVPLLLTPPAWAQEFRVGSLVIEHPWIRATPKAAPVAAGFAIITNSGGETDRLISVVSPIAETVQIHSMTIENDVMNMQELRDGLEIPAGATVELKPRSYHLMFMGLRQDLSEGDLVDVQLVFERAGEVTVEFVVEPASADDHMQM
jgi:copper(I)-binding protein